MIEARGLTRRYSGNGGITDVTFTAEPGRITGFLGPNGAGKSTTMRLIMGLDFPASGEVTVNGRAYRDLPAPLREVGGMLDSEAVNPRRRAIEHLRVLCLTHGIPRERAEELMDRVGLGEVKRKRVGSFSLGMRQRFALAATLLGDPGVLVLDEPFNGLDLDGTRWMRQLLRGLAAEGRTVFLSSHLMAEMSELADRLVVIVNGRIAAHTTLDEFVERGGQTVVRVVCADAGRLSELLAAQGAVSAVAGQHSLDVTGPSEEVVRAVAARGGVEVYEVESKRASLEEAFLELTRNQGHDRGERA